MIPLPIPYEDETIGSLLLRAARTYGISMWMMKRLLAGEAGKGAPEVNLRLLPSIAKTLGYLMKIEDLYWEHTFLPAVTPHLAKKETLKWRKKFKSIPLSVLQSRSTGSYYRYCPLCVEEQVNTLGESYWKREWLVYGGCWCPKHKCALHITDQRLSKPKLMPEECSGEPMRLTKNGFWRSCLGSYFLQEEREVKIEGNRRNSLMDEFDSENLETEDPTEFSWLGRFWPLLRMASKGEISLDPLSRNKLVVFITF